MIIYREYLHTYLLFLVGPPAADVPSAPPHPHPCKKNQIWILCHISLTGKFKIRVVGFVLQNLLTYFKMLIVPHALNCVDSCIFRILPQLTAWHTVLVSARTPPPPPPRPPLPEKKNRFRFFVKIYLLESSKLELKGLCLKVTNIFRNVV